MLILVIVVEQELSDGLCRHEHLSFFPVADQALQVFFRRVFLRVTFHEHYPVGRHIHTLVANLEHQSHVVAHHREAALQHLSARRLGLQFEVEADEVARRAVVCLLVQLAVVDDSLVHLLLRVPSDSHVVEVGGLAGAVEDTCLDRCAVGNADDHERQVDGFFVVGRNSEIVLIIEEAPRINLEVEVVGERAPGIAHIEADDALWGHRLTIGQFGCIYPCRLPLSAHPRWLHLHVLVASCDLNHPRKRHIRVFGTSFGWNPYDACKDLSGSFASQQRIAKLLVDAQLTTVGMLRVFTVFFSLRLALGQRVAKQSYQHGQRNGPWPLALKPMRCVVNHNVRICVVFCRFVKVFSRIGGRTRLRRRQNINKKSYSNRLELGNGVLVIIFGDDRTFTVHQSRIVAIAYGFFEFINMPLVRSHITSSAPEINICAETSFRGNVLWSLYDICVLTTGVSLLPFCFNFLSLLIGNTHKFQDISVITIIAGDVCNGQTYVNLCPFPDNCTIKDVGGCAGVLVIRAFYFFYFRAINLNRICVSGCNT